MREYKVCIAERQDVEANTIKALKALVKGKVDTKIAELHATTKVDDRDCRTSVAVAGCGYELRVIKGLGVIVPAQCAYLLCSEVSDKENKAAYRLREKEIKETDIERSQGKSAWMAEEVVVQDDIEANGFTSYDLIVYQCTKKH